MELKQNQIFTVNGNKYICLAGNDGCKGNCPFCGRIGDCNLPTKFGDCCGDLRSDKQDVHIEHYPRKIYKIANEIKKLWKNVNPSAKHCLEVMQYMITKYDCYGYDTCNTIIRTFLANAKTFKGNRAQEIKEELKIILNQ